MSGAESDANYGVTFLFNPIRDGYTREHFQNEISSDESNYFQIFVHFALPKKIYIAQGFVEGYFYKHVENIVDITPNFHQYTQHVSRIIIYKCYQVS